MRTAVEWLQIKMATASTEEMVENINVWFEQAKEMEKEYIKKGWLQDRDITFGDWQQEFEQWYSQEFKQQEQ